MAKEKGKKGVANKHLHARISFLQKAATLLLTGSTEASDSSDFPIPSRETSQGSAPGTFDYSRYRNNTAAGRTAVNDEPQAQRFSAPAVGGLPLRLASHLRQVANKGIIRLDRSVKHAICKGCNTPFAHDQVYHSFVENLSRETSRGKKVHADVLVIKCSVCGAAKRFPVGAKRQQRKSLRGNEPASSRAAQIKGKVPGP